ncbi:hypothetical protein KP509_09G027100 [Ceratopteris richardii]|nr:hypothetical protein KP509_09G027100 [Ceratopteris richardii]
MQPWDSLKVSCYENPCYLVQIQNLFALVQNKALFWWMYFRGA